MRGTSSTAFARSPTGYCEYFIAYSKGVTLRLRRALIAMSLLAVACATRAEGAAKKPSVLFCTVQGPANGPFLDLEWLRELHRAGFEPDYLGNHVRFKWDRIRRYNCLVIFGCPAAEKGKRSFQFHGVGPRRKEYIDLIERYLKAGGGVLLMVYTDSGDQYVRQLIEPWGARLPVEYYVETDQEKLAPMPRMQSVTLSLVDQVLPSPVSAGVKRLWLPYGKYYHSSFSGPIAVSKDWQVVVKGSKTSRTEPVDVKHEFINTSPHPDPLVRPGGVTQPDLIAIRPYKSGRIMLCSQAPMFSIGQGTQWLYDRRCLSKGMKGQGSDLERLLHNSLRWLAGPSLKSAKVGGYRAKPSRFDPPNYDPKVRQEFERHYWSDAELDLHRSPRGGPVFRGLIGAQSALTAGKGTVAEYAAAAGKAKLDFVIFLERFADLTPEKLRQLGEQCRRHSSDKLLLLPGYAIDTNTGNHMFFWGHDLPWPHYPELLTGPNNKLLNLQPQDKTGKYVHLTTLTGWILSEHDRYNKNNIGFYNFDAPHGMQLPDVKDCSAAAIRFYRDGKLVQDLTDAYLTTVQGTCPPAPVAVSIVRSPAELVREAGSGNALTFAQGRSLATLVKDALRWSSQYDALNVFSSDGPIIRAWPQHYRAYVYGAEPFVVDRELMVSDLHVTSEVGLREIRVMNGHRLVRRFLPGGAKAYRQVLHLPGAVQRNLVLIATDVRGGKAVSFPRVSWKSGSRIVGFCGDHVNDCGYGYLGRGVGMFQAHRFPLFFAGRTWDGGPKGRRPVVHLSHNHPTLTSSLGTEGGEAFNNLPILEFSDDQAIVARSVLREVYDPRLPAMNAWHAFGPKYPSRLIESTRRYTEFNRPLKGVRATGWAAIGDRTGAVVANFANTVTFKKDQTVKNLQLLRSNWFPPRPVVLVVGHGRSYKEQNLLGHKGQIEESIATGQWFGFFSPQAYNGVLFVNRGDPIRVVVDFGGNSSWSVGVMADLQGKTVKAGDRFRHELFSVNEAMDTESRGPKRFRRVLDYLAQPEGMTIVRGTRRRTLGFFDVEADAVDKPVELKVTKPAEPIALTIPVRVLGLNPKWSAGLLQVAGHSTGYYGNGKNAYTTLGFDFDGRAYAALYPDQADLTHVVIGHPVVCDKPELFIEVMPRSRKKGRGYQWHIAVNNPTDKPVKATFRTGMKLPGLAFRAKTLAIPAGGHVVLQR